MPSKTVVVPDLAPADLSWLKGLHRSGIGTWETGNRPLKPDEFERIKRLIATHGLPCTYSHDAHDVLFIKIHVPSSVPDIEPEAVLGLAYDNIPGFVYAARDHRAFRDQAEEQLLAMAKTPRNRELVALYKLRTEELR